MTDRLQTRLPLIGRWLLSALSASSNRYVANTIWMSAEQIARLLSALFVGIAVARHLGTADFGSLSYALAFSAMFLPLARLGLDGILVRELVRHPGRAKHYLYSAAWLKLLSAAASSVLCIAAAFIISDGTPEIFYIALLAASSIFQCTDVAEAYFQSKVEARYSSVCKLIQLAVTTTARIALVFLDAPLQAFVFVAVLDQATLGLLYLYVLRGAKLLSYGLRPSIPIARRLVSDSWPLIISSSATAMYMRIDQVMIGNLLDSSAVGVYSAAVRLSEVCYVIPVIICNSIYPALVSVRGTDDSTYFRRAAILLESLVMASLCIAIPTTIWADDLVHLLYGETFKEAGAVLRVHIWTSIFVFLGTAGGRLLMVDGLTRVTMNRTLAGLTINIGLNLLLIPKYGILGAAIATLLSQLTSSLLLNYIDPRSRVYFWIQVRAIIAPCCTLFSIYKNPK